MRSRSFTTWKERNWLQVGIQEKSSNIRKRREKFKALLVEKSFSQQKGKYYDKIFSPVSRHTSIRAVLSLVASNDMFLK